jgi:hypothetical protein
MSIKQHFLPCLAFPDWSFSSVQYVQLVGLFVWLVGWFWFGLGWADWVRLVGFG